MKELLIQFIPAILLTFVIQIVLHEIGHMVFGRITGWRLIYLQIYNRAVVKVGKVYRVRHISTTGFQCIMYPDQLCNSALLYTLGGCILNAFGAGIGLICLMILYDNPILWLYSWSFFVSGIILLLVNGIPATKRICNDGACFKLLLADTLTKQYHNLQLMIAKEIYEGKTYRQINRGIICKVPEDADNDILAYQAVLEYYYWMDLDEYNLMKQALSKIDMKSTNSRNIRDIIDMEFLYRDMIFKIKDNSIKLIDNSKYYGDVPKYIKLHETAGDVHSLRVKATWIAYESFRKGNKEAAIKELNTTIEQIVNMDCLYKGEAIFCVQQITKIRSFLSALR